MNFKQSLKNKYSILVVIDIFMMILLIINLSLILFDYFFSIPDIGQFFKMSTPHFYALYHDNIHTNFRDIDLIFVAIFLTEFIFSWILAIVRKVYHKWFFYPFIHWYDLIGCIPVETFRFVRILRVFSILIRLQNLNIIDLSNTYLFKKLKKYYGILVEEVADRVVVNILEGVQDEIANGGPVLDNIINDVIRPKQDLLVEWVSRRLEHVIKSEVMVRKEEISDYVNSLISESLNNNTQLQTIEQVPFMGKVITKTIEDSISKSINSVIEKVMADLASGKNRILVNETTNAIINAFEYKDDEAQLNKIFTDISVGALEVIKKEVEIKKWKLKEDSGKNAGKSEQMGIEFLMSEKS